MYVRVEYSTQSAHALAAFISDRARPALGILLYRAFTVSGAGTYIRGCGRTHAYARLLLHASPSQCRQERTKQRSTARAASDERPQQKAGRTWTADGDVKDHAPAASALARSSGTQQGQAMVVACRPACLAGAGGAAGGWAGKRRRGRLATGEATNSLAARLRQRRY